MGDNLVVIKMINDNDSIYHSFFDEFLMDGLCNSTTRFSRIIGTCPS